MASPEDTGSYDMLTYAHAFEQLEALHLPCFWKITPLKKGIMLVMEKGGEHERIFVESPTAFSKWSQVIVDWATGKGFGLS